MKIDMSEDESQNNDLSGNKSKEYSCDINNCTDGLSATNEDESNNIRA